MPGRRWLRDLPGPLLLTAVAALLLRNALVPGRIPGGALSEAWGRLFVTAQVGRWVRGEAPWGRADLLAWPEGMSFWPVDPLLQAVQLPLSALAGDLAGLGLATLVLLALAGIGPYVLARVAGAGALGATIGGLVVQLSPYLLRHATDLVLETLAVGPVALAAAALLHHLRDHRGHPLLVGLSVLGVAATSPYYAVYLALTCGLLLLVTPRSWRRWATAAAAGAAACALALLPLLVTESGPHGRLGPGFSGRGFEVAPTALVLADGSPVRRQHQSRRQAAQAPTTPEHPPEAAGRARRPPPGPPAWERAVHRLPGGGVVLLLMLGGLLHRRARPWAALGLLLLFAGPEPWRNGNLLGLPLPRWEGPLGWVLSRLPLLEALGNPGRLTALAVLAASIAGARLTSSWRPLSLPLAFLLVGELLIRHPGLALPATTVEIPTGPLAALDGPTVIFPSGDPPFWHPEVAPKEVLFLAGRAGVPVAYDYGRLRSPADLAVQARLSAISNTPLGIVAYQSAPPLPDTAAAWAAQPFTALLVLEDRLDDEARHRLLSWLEAHARLRVRSGAWSAWDWPAGVPAKP